MKIVFMGTPEFSVPALMSLYYGGIDISLVITQQDKPKGRGKKMQFTPVKEKALELGLEVIQPINVNDQNVVTRLREINPDFIVVVAYGQILRKEILDIPKFHCLNIHASLLPKYRGAAPINWAIINGDEKTGITIMKMEEGLDTGPMILKKEIPITKEDDAVTIHDKLSLIGGELILKAIEAILHNNAKFQPQDHLQSSYAPMLYKGLGDIKWSESVDVIYNRIRGLKPWPWAYTSYKGEMVKIHSAQVERIEHDIPYGTIHRVDNKGIYVSAKDGYVIVKELQFPNKKKMSVEEYLRGNKIEEGNILGKEG